MGESGESGALATVRGDGDGEKVLELVLVAIFGLDIMEKSSSPSSWRTKQEHIIAVGS